MAADRDVAQDDQEDEVARARHAATGQIAFGLGTVGIGVLIGLIPDERTRIAGGVMLIAGALIAAAGASDRQANRVVCDGGDDGGDDDGDGRGGG